MKNILFTALIAIAASLVTWQLLPSKTTDGTPKAKETAYERVMRTGTLRCGYGAWAPFVMKDVNTGKMTGAFVEMIEQMGVLTGLNIEWASEIDWGQIPSALGAGKIDAHCAGMWPDGNRIKHMAVTEPLTYMEVGILVRGDDTRFPVGQPVDIAKLNNSEFTVAVVEGDVMDTIAKTVVPNAKKNALPILAGFGDAVAHLESRKADFLIGPKVAADAIRKSGIKVRFVEPTTSFQAYGNVMAVGINETALWHVLNGATRELLQNNTYNEIIKRYQTEYPNAILRPAKPYQK